MSFQEPPPHPSSLPDLPPPSAPVPAAPAAPTPAPAPAAPPQPVAVAYTPSIVVETKTGPGMLVRAIWFVFVGWWLTGIVSSVAWAAMVTIIGLPLGIWLINRIPTFLTLRPRTTYAYAWSDSTGQVHTSATKLVQTPWYLRLIWFLVVGWWASAALMSVAYVLCVIIVTLPIGLMLFNRVPFVASLYRY